MKYAKPGSEWISPKRHDYRMMCCDCGLTHSLDFRLKKEGKGNVIQFRCFLAPRSTAMARRHPQRFVPREKR